MEGPITCPPPSTHSYGADSRFARMKTSRRAGGGRCGCRLRGKGRFTWDGDRLFRLPHVFGGTSRGVGCGFLGSGRCNTLCIPERNPCWRGLRGGRELAGLGGWWWCATEIPRAGRWTGGLDWVPTPKTRSGYGHDLVIWVLVWEAGLDFTGFSFIHCVSQT